MFQQPNLKYYILISGAVLLILILLVSLPMVNKTTNNNTPNSLVPTTVEVNRTTPIPPTIEVGAFTGGLSVTLEPQEAKLVIEKKDLRLKSPLALSTFSIDFDYAEDKFAVTLNIPKDQALNEFRKWLSDNYPNLPIGEFILK